MSANNSSRVPAGPTGSTAVRMGDPVHPQGLREHDSITVFLAPPQGPSAPSREWRDLGARTGVTELSCPLGVGLPQRDSSELQEHLCSAEFCLGSLSPTRLGLRRRISPVSEGGPRRVPGEAPGLRIQSLPLPGDKEAVPKKNPISANPAPAVCVALSPAGPERREEAWPPSRRSSQARVGTMSTRPPRAALRRGQAEPVCSSEQTGRSLAPQGPDHPTHHTSSCPCLGFSLCDTRW